jgi:hypothetical protein
MPKSFFLINVILFIIICILGINLYKTWMNPLDIPVQSTYQETKAVNKKRTVLKDRKTDAAAYQVIVDKDLFRPSRTPVSASADATQTVPSGDTPQLFGTTIMDNGSFAILEEPSTKISKLYFVNDTIAGFTVSDIQSNKVILTRGGEKVELKLREKKNFKPAKAPSIKVPKKPRPSRTRRRPPSRQRTPSPATGN